MNPASSSLSDRRAAWCALLILIALIPLGMAWAAMVATAPGPGGARWGPFLAFLAAYALLFVVEFACIGFLWYSVRQGRLRTPLLARWTSGVALILLVPPALYLAYGA